MIFFFLLSKNYQNMFHCTFLHDVRVYTFAKCETKKMPFPNIVKLDQRPKVQGSRITIYHFHCQKRVKEILDISTFGGKYLLTSIYPKNFALAKKTIAISAQLRLTL